MSPITKKGILFKLIFGILLFLGMGKFIAFSFEQVSLETEMDWFFTMGMAVFGSLLGAMAMLCGLGLVISGIIDLICFLKKVDYLGR